MSVKLGIAPIAWSNDDMPELGGDTSLETCLSEAREAGFTGDICDECGSSKMVRNGTCLKCNDCGSTTGCS